MGKSWIEKRDINKNHNIKINQKNFADIPAGISILVPTPKIIDKFVKQIPVGSFFCIKEIRVSLANQYKAEMTCPVVTGISLRIIAEAAYEEYINEEVIDRVTPFWRVVHPDSKLIEKLACGKDFVIERQSDEKIEF